MFSKLLVATDLSEFSDKFICAMDSLRSLGAREVLLIHCFNIRDVKYLSDRLQDFALPAFENRLMVSAEPAFERQRKSLEAQGYQTEARMVLGLPHVEINRIAAESRCDVIIVGSRGRTNAADLMLGNVSSAVIHSAVKPVLVLRLAPGACDQTATENVIPCAPLEHLLFPTDFSTHAEHAFSYVKQIVEHGAKHVTLLHVQDQGRIDRYLKDRLDEFNRIDFGRMECLKAELTSRGVKQVDIEIPYGSPKHEVIARTRKGDISLVVMGCQGRGYIGDVFLGSVSQAVVGYSAAPVLLIPAPNV